MFFDFVNVKKPKSMLKMNNRESIPPLALTTILFFLWGFAYGFLDILNGQFQLVTGLSQWGALGLHAAYYGGYIVAPLTVGRVVLTRWGFKSTFITGLCIYACGTLIFWPSAVLTSFPAFVVSNFIVGSGLAVLETAANPFIALCGPQENSEVRLNFSQAIQATGSVLSPLLAKKVLFKSVQSAAILVEVQWTYLAIALFDILLAVAFYYLPVPEASDDDLRELADRRKDENNAKVAGVPVVWLTFCMGVVSQFFYVGGQEGLSTSYTDLVNAVAPNAELNSFDYLLIGRTVFALGRFLAALAQWFLKPRWILLVSYIGMIVFSVLCKEVGGMGGAAMGILLFLFESGAFSIIFAISLRGLGAYTKTGAAIMTAAISGGAIFPFPQRVAAIRHGTPYSFVVLAAVFSAGAIFPLYLNFVPAVRKQVDPVPNEYLRRHHRRRRQRRDTVVHREKENVGLGGVLSRPRSLMDEPFSDVHISGGIEGHNHASASSGSSHESPTPPGGVPGGGGGLMHELAAWPDPDPDPDPGHQ
jgi:fucose permease